VQFDGMGDSIGVPALEAPADFTIAAWVFLNGPGSAADALVGQAGPGPDIHFEGGHLQLRTETGTAIVSETEMPVGEWVHVTVVRREGALSLYFDAEPDPATGCFFGDFGFQALAAGAGGSLDGLLDDVRFYDRALRYAEIRLLVRQLSEAARGNAQHRREKHHENRGKDRHRRGLCTGTSDH
jgi:hypothetical protein